MAVEAGIVIVSSSAHRRQFLRDVLAAADYATLEAVTRSEAIRLFSKHELSVIISDSQLSDGDWTDFVSGTADMVQPPRVIVIAPAATSSFWAEVLNLGGYDILQAPLNAEEIRRVVEGAIRTWNPTRAPVLQKAMVAAAGIGNALAKVDRSIHSKPVKKTGRTGAILVIDDDARIRNMLEIMLRGAGYDVLSAEDGPQGIEVFREHANELSLVLLDCELPGMNGDAVFDYLAAIRADVKVVVSSGRSLPDLMRLFTGRGVAEFLPKPFTSEKLNDTIRSALAA